MCLLCEEACFSPRDLFHHLKSPRHMEEEQKLEPPPLVWTHHQHDVNHCPIMCEHTMNMMWNIHVSPLTFTAIQEGKCFMFLMTVQIPLLQPVDWMCQYLVQLSLQYGKWSSHFFLDSYMGWGNPLVWTVHQLDMECVHILLDIFAAVQRERERDFLLRGSCKDWNCLQKEKVLFCRTAWVSVSLWMHHQSEIKVYMSAQLCCNGM